MITFELKKINNRPFYYLSEQIRLGNTFKKIQVFVGKNIPTDTRPYYTALMLKERALLNVQLQLRKFPVKNIDSHTLQRIEEAKLEWKYFKAQLTDSEYKTLLRKFAIRFTFESNAIEGSRLSESEVSKIVQRQYIKKSVPKIEIQEVLNAVEAFEYICSDTFTLKQKCIKHLHALVTRDLGIPTGYKKQSIVVNNKETVPPKQVRLELSKLITWYKHTKKIDHPFIRAVIFHNRFEHIHPFTDGNGRVGRLLFNVMLLNDGYGFILFKNKNRRAYMNALNAGDEGRHRNIIKLSKDTYKKTIQELISL